MLESLLSFQLFVFSNLLLLFLVDAPHDSFASREIVFIFDADETLIHCVPGCFPHQCVVNQEAVEFLHWAREESRRPSSFIDPHFTVFSNGVFTDKKIASAFDRYKVGDKNHVSLTSSPLEIQDYNLNTFFLGRILDLAENQHVSLRGPKYNKNLIFLRRYLPTIFSQMKDMKRKFILLIDDDIVHYETEICYKQSFLEGSGVIVIKSFTDGENEEKGFHSRSQLGLRDVALAVQGLLNHHEQSNTPIVMDEILDLFQPPPEERCLYSLKNPNPFYSTLVLDLTDLRLLSVEALTAFLTEFLQTKFPPTSIDGAFDALMFSCISKVHNDIPCITMEKVAQTVFAQVVEQSTDQDQSTRAPRFQFVTSSKDPVYLGLASLLPQRTTLIVKIISSELALSFSLLEEEYAEDRPNICYVFGKADSTADSTADASKPRTLKRRVGRRLKKMGKSIVSFGKKLFSPVRSLFRWCIPQKLRKEKEATSTIPGGSTSVKTSQLKQSPLQPEASALEPPFDQSGEEKALSSLMNAVQVVKTLRKIRSAVTGTEKHPVMKAMERLRTSFSDRVLCAFA